MQKFKLAFGITLFVMTMPCFAYISLHKSQREVTPKYESASERGNPAFYDVFGQRYFVKKSSEDYYDEGIASWYGPNFHGKSTSSGEMYNMYGLTAAHKELPIPCYVRVTNLENGKHIVVKVNDRGPFHEGRIIDLSFTAAKRLGMLANGTAKVAVTALPPFQHLDHFSKNFATDMTQKLYLQLGAFGQQANAEDFARHLKSLINKPVSIFQSQLNFGNIYRVKIGPFQTPQEAEAINTQLANAGLSKGMFVHL